MWFIHSSSEDLMWLVRDTKIQMIQRSNDTTFVDLTWLNRETSVNNPNHSSIFPRMHK